MSADMPFLRCDEELPYLLGHVDVVRTAAEKRSFHDGLWDIDIPTPWDGWDFIRLPTAYTHKIAFKRRMHVQQSRSILLV